MLGSSGAMGAGVSDTMSQVLGRQAGRRRGLIGALSGLFRWQAHPMCSAGQPGTSLKSFRPEGGSEASGGSGSGWRELSGPDLR